MEVEKAHLKLEKEALNELKKTYETALNDIKERAKSLKSDEMLESKIRQLNYQKALETQVSGILDVLKTDNTITINKYLTKAYENGFVGTLYNMQNEEIPLALGIDQKQVLTSISKKIENMTFADREYTNMNDFKKKIKAEITRGIANNAKYPEIARNLDNVTQEGVNSSYRICRTEMGRISQESKFDCMVRAKENGADIVKQWDSTMDSRTRESHSKLDGQVREIEEPFEIDGEKAMFPCGFGKAHLDINCRCVVLERARWAIEAELSGENTFTKAIRNKDGTTEIREFNTSSYNAFKKDFFKWQEEVNKKADLENKIQEVYKFVLAKGLKNNKENLYVIDINGNDIYKMNGEKSSVTFDDELIGILENSEENSIILVHNHPKSSSFSSADINVALNYKSIKEMRVIAHDEKTEYLLDLKDNAFNGKNINKEYSDSKSKFYMEYFNKVQNNELAPNEAWYQHSNDILEDLSKKYDWKYERIIKK